MRENCAMKLETFCMARSLISVWVRTRTQTLAEHPFWERLHVARCTLIAPHRPRAGPSILSPFAPFAAFRCRVISVWKIDRLVSALPTGPWGGLDDSSRHSSSRPLPCLVRVLLSSPSHIKLHKCQPTVMTTSCKRPIIFIINDIGALSLCIIIIEHPGACHQGQIPQYLTFSTSFSYSQSVYI